MDDLIIPSIIIATVLLIANWLRMRVMRGFKGRAVFEQSIKKVNEAHGTKFQADAANFDMRMALAHGNSSYSVFTRHGTCLLFEEDGGKNMVAVLRPGTQDIEVKPLSWIISYEADFNFIKYGPMRQYERTEGRFKVYTADVRNPMLEFDFHGKTGLEWAGRLDAMRRR